jgi:exonuclease SbcC
MRPVALELRGFTAFRDPQEIDLSGLDLFALWGPTGSGKSSVLDAMTYALYGKVERVGNQISQLVSQGQPRMSVMLTFEVDGRLYRITRSTPASGASKVLLERRDDAEWQSFGEGADRAQGVKRAVVQLLGLDYNAFTRAVLLPQGKFAEFLVGDATERRAILTELLGLELFGRMAALARGAAQDAKKSAEARLSLLESFADVDEAALEGAAREAERAVAAVAEHLSSTRSTIVSLAEAASPSSDGSGAATPR